MARNARCGNGTTSEERRTSSGARRRGENISFVGGTSIEESSPPWGIAALIIVLSVFLRAALLWLALKIVRVQGSYLILVAASAIAGAVAFIPRAGTLLSLLVMILLVWRLTAAELWPDTILTVIVSWLLALLLGLLLLGLLD